MLATYLQYVVIVFTVAALLLWTGAAYVFAVPNKPYAWGWGCIAVAAAAQLVLFLMH
jgi:amino acid transporter